MPAMQPELNNSVQLISDLLATSTQSPLRVPDYQRSYSWRKKQFRELWEDLNEFTFDDSTNDATYFLGAIVLVGRNDLEILDGQQRLTTATILLTCLTDFLDAEGEKSYAADVFGDYVAKRERGGPNTMYKLVLNRHDESYFRELIQDRADPPDPVSQSHKNIKACRDFFNAELRKWQRDHKEFAADRMRKLADTLLDRVYAVTINAFNLSSAGYVFERLNDRGVGLSSVDLVRSLVMQRCGEENRDFVLDSWGEIFSVEWPGNVDDLLRYHWVSRFGDANTGALYALVKEKFKSKQPGFDALSFTRDLRDAAHIYKRIYGAAWGADVFANVCAGVVELNAKPLIPLLMKLHDFPKASRDLLSRVVLTAFVRNRLVANLSSTTFEDEVYAVAKDLTDDDAAVQAARSSILAHTIDDDEFRRAFLARSLTVQRQAAFLLRNLEFHRRRQEKLDELTIASADDVHVEHILPRNPSEDSKWEDHDEWVNRIGNLTLWSGIRNTGAGNEPFNEKRERYVGSELLLTRELSEANHWDSEAIQARQQRLAEIAVKVWPKEG